MPAVAASDGRGLRVFLVPVGAGRHELYSEPADERPAAHAPEAAGRWRRAVERFRAMLAEAERARRDRAAGAPAPRGRVDRIKARVLRWVAEAIAEQRLLWHLRTCTAATLVYPADLDAREAERVLRLQLARDYEKHRRWFAIDLLALLGTAALTLVPGPNVLAYYFLFRVVGHFLSMRGARQGLDRAGWTFEASDALAAVRQALALAPRLRRHRLDEIASMLRLEHLAAFVERTAAV
ncbi:MAG TPA: hypothetical protein VNI83_14970 [Vicinamibacterales bacterium]|nr:hypothetical protein [Vicinamibacterales bacterium]